MPLGVICIWMLPRLLSEIVQAFSEVVTWGSVRWWLIHSWWVSWPPPWQQEFGVNCWHLTSACSASRWWILCYKRLADADSLIYLPLEGAQVCLTLPLWPISSCSLRHKCDAECLSSHQFLKEEWVKHKCDVSLVYYFLCCSLSSEKHRKQVSFHFGHPLSFFVMVIWSFSNGLSDPSKTYKSLLVQLRLYFSCPSLHVYLYLSIHTSVNVVPNMWHVGQSEVAGANNVSGIQIYLCNTEYKILMFPARWRESEVVGANSLTLSMLCIRLSPIPPRMKIYILTQKYSSNTHTWIPTVSRLFISHHIFFLLLAQLQGWQKCLAHQIEIYKKSKKIWNCYCTRDRIHTYPVPCDVLQLSFRVDSLISQL